VRRYGARVCLFICASSIFSCRISISTVYNDEGVLKWAGARCCVGRRMHVCVGHGVGWVGRTHSKVFFCRVFQLGARQTIFL
jgi:hypothetical protein